MTELTKEQLAEIEALYQCARDDAPTKRLLAHIRAQDEKLAERDEKLRRVEELRDELKRMSDVTYCRSLDIARKPEFLGWEIKVQRGEFGRKELDTHCESERQMGKHQGYADSLNKIDAILNGSTT